MQVSSEKHSYKAVKDRIYVKNKEKKKNQFE